MLNIYKGKIDQVEDEEEDDSSDSKVKGSSDNNAWELKFNSLGDIYGEIEGENDEKVIVSGNSLQFF